MVQSQSCEPQPRSSPWPTKIEPFHLGVGAARGASEVVEEDLAIVYGLLARAVGTFYVNVGARPESTPPVGVSSTDGGEHL